MKTVYLVRHGMTEGNKVRAFQHPDTELAPEGLEQAKFVGERFRTIPVDIIVSSTMKRAHQTAEQIAETTGKGVFTTELLQEVRVPSALVGKSRLDPEFKEIGKKLRTEIGNLSWRHSDEEKYLDLKARAEKALAYLIDRDEAHIVAVTHGLILKMLLAVMVMGDLLTPEAFVKFDTNFVIYNTGITKTVYEEGEWRVVTWNDHAHFGETPVPVPPTF